MANGKSLEGLIINDRAKQKLKGTGFDSLLLLSSQFNIPTNLLTAVVDAYNIERRCFRLGDTNIFFGLGDVLRIMAIPIDGRPIIETDEDPSELCKEYFGEDISINPDDRKGGITLKSLRKYCNDRKDHALEGQDLDCYIRALVLYLIGSFIIPTGSHIVAPVYLLFLKNIEEIGSYAWGAALLANLHRHLENHIKYRGFIYANVHFLTVRITLIFIVSFV